MSRVTNNMADIRHWKIFNMNSILNCSTDCSTWMSILSRRHKCSRALLQDAWTIILDPVSVSHCPLHCNVALTVSTLPASAGFIYNGFTPQKQFLEKFPNVVATEFQQLLNFCSRRKSRWVRVNQAWLSLCSVQCHAHSLVPTLPTCSTIICHLSSWLF